MNKVLIIGGNGFIGSHLSSHLEQSGYKILVYDIIKSHIPFIPCNTESSFILADVLNYDTLLKSMKDVTHVVVSSALLHIDDNITPSYHELEVNIRSIHNVITAASECESVKSVMILNSEDSYGTVKSLYAYRAHYTLTLANQLQVKVIVVNLGSIYGPGQDILSSGSIPTLVRYALSNREILRYGHNGVNLIYISDLLPKLVSLMELRETIVISLSGSIISDILDLSLIVDNSLSTLCMSHYKYQYSTDNFLIRHTSPNTHHDLYLDSIPLSIGIPKYLLWVKKCLSGGDMLLKQESSEI